MSRINRVYGEVNPNNLQWENVERTQIRYQNRIYVRRYDKEGYWWYYCNSCQEGPDKVILKIRVPTARTGSGDFLVSNNPHTDNLPRRTPGPSPPNRNNSGRNQGTNQNQRPPGPGQLYTPNQQTGTGNVTTNQNFPHPTPRSINNGPDSSNRGPVTNSQNDRFIGNNTNYRTPTQPRQPARRPNQNRMNPGIIRVLPENISYPNARATIFVLLPWDPNLPNYINPQNAFCDFLTVHDEHQRRELPRFRSRINENGIFCVDIEIPNESQIEGIVYVKMVITDRGNGRVMRSERYQAFRISRKTFQPSPRPFPLNQPDRSQIIFITPSTSPLQGSVAHVFFTFGIRNLMNRLSVPGNVQNLQCVLGPFSETMGNKLAIVISPVTLASKYKAIGKLKETYPIEMSKVAQHPACLLVMVFTPSTERPQTVNVGLRVKNSQFRTEKKGAYRYVGPERSLKEKEIISEVKKNESDYDFEVDYPKEFGENPLQFPEDISFSPFPMVHEHMGPDEVDALGANALFYAIANNNKDLVTHYMTKGKYDYWKQDIFNFSAVDILLYFKHESLLPYLNVSTPLRPSERGEFLPLRKLEVEINEFGKLKHRGLQFDGDLEENGGMFFKFGCSNAKKYGCRFEIRKYLEAEESHAYFVSLKDHDQRCGANERRGFEISRTIQNDTSIDEMEIPPPLTQAIVGQEDVPKKKRKKARVRKKIDSSSFVDPKVSGGYEEWIPKDKFIITCQYCTEKMSILLGKSNGEIADVRIKHDICGAKSKNTEIPGDGVSILHPRWTDVEHVSNEKRHKCLEKASDLLKCFRDRKLSVDCEKCGMVDFDTIVVGKHLITLSLDKS